MRGPSRGPPIRLRRLQPAEAKGWASSWTCGSRSFWRVCSGSHACKQLHTSQGWAASVSSDASRLSDSSKVPSHGPMTKSSTRNPSRPPSPADSRRSSTHASQSIRMYLPVISSEKDKAWPTRSAADRAGVVAWSVLKIMSSSSSRPIKQICFWALELSRSPKTPIATKSATPCGYY